MQIEVLDVYALKDMSYLTPITCDNFSEAAAVCLENQQHPQEVIVTIEGDLTKQFKLVWKAVSQQMIDSRDDMNYTAEDGAYCLALIVMKKLANLEAFKQSRRKTGFDYWMGQANEQTGMQRTARLEVSGILKGTKGQINERVKEKIEQTKQSDHLNIPAYVVIVEFSRPLIKIIKR